MNQIAVSTSSFTLYWSSIVIVLSVAAGFAFSAFLYRSSGGKGITFALFVPVCIVLSLFLSRFVHWYCHPEQYAGFSAAITNYATGDFVLSGALIGSAAAAFIAGRLTHRRPGAVLDCFAPGAALIIAGIRFSSLFSSSCRSKIAVTVPSRQHLPLAAQFTDSAGNVEYRFATFFVEAIVLIILFASLTVFFFTRRSVRAKNKKRNTGSVALMFLVWYSVIEILMDSTRFDSSFARSNGFVSMVQMVCGVSLLLALVYYSVRCIRADGLRAYQWLCWAGWLVFLGGVGVCEYLVQRHGDWYLSCYAGMSLCLILTGITITVLYHRQCLSRSGEKQ